MRKPIKRKKEPEIAGSASLPLIAVASHAFHLFGGRRRLGVSDVEHVPLQLSLDLIIQVENKTNDAVRALRSFSIPNNVKRTASVV
jgi:hypothetical protein